MYLSLKAVQSFTIGGTSPPWRFTIGGDVPQMMFKLFKRLNVFVIVIKYSATNLREKLFKKND